MAVAHSYCYELLVYAVAMEMCISIRCTFKLQLMDGYREINLVGASHIQS